MEKNKIKKDCHKININGVDYPYFFSCSLDKTYEDYSDRTKFHVLKPINFI